MSANPVIVIDVSSDTIRAGIAGNEESNVAFPAVIGVPKASRAMQGVESKDLYVGHQAIERKEYVDLRHAIVGGTIQDWTGFESILSHVFDEELRIDANGQVVLITDAPSAPREQREKLLEMLFDRYGVSGASMRTSNGSMPSETSALKSAVSLKDYQRTKGRLLSRLRVEQSSS